MAIINIEFASEVLGRYTNLCVLTPQISTKGAIGIENGATNGKFKTLLLLHGLSDDYTRWSSYTSIERYAMQNGIAVIMPSGDRGFYTDMKHGDRYYTFISDEVLKIARAYLPLSDKREDNFIAGNSMGGYGALKIALKNPDKFAAAAGLSTVADVELFMTKHTPHMRENIFGNGRVPESEDLFCLAKKCNEEKIKPRIYMGVGKGDYMYEENLRLRDTFKSLDYDFTYRDSEGVHDWNFWDEYIQYVIKWMLEK